MLSAAVARGPVLRARAGRGSLRALNRQPAHRAPRRAALGVRASHDGQQSYDPLAKALPPPEGLRFELEKGVNNVLVEGVVSGPTAVLRTQNRRG